MLDAGALLACDADGVVLAAAVDHDAFVAECQAVEAVADLGGLVPGDDDGAYEPHDPLNRPCSIGIPVQPFCSTCHVCESISGSLAPTPTKHPGCRQRT